jgi:hypothetical protein
MNPHEARRWKDGVYGLMKLWGLEPGDLLTPTADGPENRQFVVG